MIGRTPLDASTEAVAEVGMTFAHAFNTSTKITDNVLVESGASNTMTRDTLALQVKMNSSLALSVGYEVDDNSSPPPGPGQRTRSPP